MSKEKNCINCKNEKDAREISFSIANSSLVKTAIAGEDPNWGRIVMSVGKSNAKVDIKKLSIKIGPYKVFTKGILDKDYKESNVADYMKNDSIELTVDLSLGNKYFTAYTMDLTKNYIAINTDYRS